MFSPFRLLWISGFAGVAGLLTPPSASAAPLLVTFSPQSAGLNGTSFTATKLNLLDYARVDLGTTTGGRTAFTEKGFLLVNNAQVGSAVPFSLPTVGAGYELYIQFTAVGFQTLPSFNGASTGVFTTLNATLFGVNGPATFGLTAEDSSGTPTGASQPFITAGGAPISLATGTVINGTTTFTLNPVGAGSNITETFNPIPGFVTSPTNVALDLSGAFNNNAQIVTIANGGKTFLLNGGGGDASFFAVPEPASFAIVTTGIGLLAMAFRRKASKTAS